MCGEMTDSLQHTENFGLVASGNSGIHSLKHCTPIISPLLRMSGKK